MSFEIDVLIVYSNADNEPTENNTGWVDDFKWYLELMLTQVRGSKANVLKKADDDVLTGADLSKVAVYLPVLSDAYISSDSCLNVLDEFIKLGDGQLSRVFSILKEPLTRHEVPQVIKDRPSHRLYQMNLDIDYYEDFEDVTAKESEKSFWMEIVDLAYEINELLSKGGERINNLTDLGSKSIYLAETGQDLSTQRNAIKRELLKHGCKVLPSKSLPSEVDQLEVLVRKEIEECRISIHLIGNSYGEVPLGSDRSVVDIQNRIASDHSALKNKRNFNRLIWICPDLENANEKQLSFIESVKRDSSSSESAEILQTPLEDFKNIIRDELIESPAEAKLNIQPEYIATSNKKLIYLLHNQVDEANIEPLKELIKKKGFDIVTPSFQGKPLELRKLHIDKLKNLDAAVIYNGIANQAWLNMKLLDLLKAPGFGRNKPILGTAIVHRKEKTVIARDYKKYEATHIVESDSNALEQLNAFLEELG